MRVGIRAVLQCGPLNFAWPSEQLTGVRRCAWSTTGGKAPRTLLKPVQTTRLIGLEFLNGMSGSWAAEVNRIRRLQAEDWRLLREVRLEMLSDTPMAYVESLAAARRQTDSQWQERAAAMSSDSSITLVADDGADGSRISGLMRVVIKQPQDPSQARQAMLISVYVAPEHRGLGLADQLLDEACSVAGAELGAGVIELGVHEDNARAKAFYARHGFEATGDARPYPQDNAKREIVMARRNAPHSGPIQPGDRAVVGR